MKVAGRVASRGAVAHAETVAASLAVVEADQGTGSEGDVVAASAEARTQ